MAAVVRRVRPMSGRLRRRRRHDDSTVLCALYATEETGGGPAGMSGRVRADGKRLRTGGVQGECRLGSSPASYKCSPVLRVPLQTRGPPSALGGGSQGALCRRSWLPVMQQMDRTA